ncbi:hypothetical protein Rs2_10692 [Raphanus sativus]|uniref:Fra a 1-associated protein n=1 Tax=Raphanus sativus TaxID=3726 RepID=A0A6J0MRY5_RAPSA|nr:fra a 1-associated protein [Raphanus sativus]KAJ4907034.1 hypothetical protein Rs2_10692 [Raphanus sativus]
MGWVWRDDDSSVSDAGNDFTDQPPRDSPAEGNFSTTTVVRSKCKTEEVEPGKFFRKCEKTEEILRHCFGKPSEVVQSTTEHTEEDVTDQMVRGPSLPNQFEENPLNFPGLRSDLDDIERHFFSGVKSFFEAAEEMKSSLFDIMGDYDSTATMERIPIQDHPKIDDEKAATRQPFSSGEIDLSGLAKDV